MSTHFLHFILTVMLLLTTLNSVSAQDFHKYRERYEHFAENDSTAFLYLTPYIRQAKAEKNKIELVQAYKDAVSFSTTRKLSYADSMLWAASQSGRKDLLAQAHLTKGTVYYFNYHKFQPALDEYLKAWKITSVGSNPYLRYKNLYHIGVVKEYLGDHSEALQIFQECKSFFQKPAQLPEPPNTKFNRTKGYLNTLHHMVASLLHLGRDEEAQSLIKEGLNKTAGTSDFFLERSYFYKMHGIALLRQQKWKDATVALETSLPGLQKKQDEANIALVYFYLGQCRLKLNQITRAVHYFSAVDTVFRRSDFLLPETRPALEYLIRHSKNKGDTGQELYFTTQLLKADRLILEDYSHLPRGMHRLYDTAELLQSKKALEHSVMVSNFVIVFSTLVIAALFIFLCYRRRLSCEATPEPSLSGIPQENTLSKDAGLTARPVPDTVADAVLQQLHKLERKHFYLQPRMTLNKLAPLVKTNTSYLSRIIRDHYDCTFTEYIRTRRIAYVTDKLQNDRMWRKYSLEHLASECGFLDYKTFSAAFMTVHGLKPSEYIRKINSDNLRDSEK